MLAALLTAVAAIFIASALLRSDDAAQEPSAFETARKPAQVEQLLARYCAVQPPSME